MITNFFKMERLRSKKIMMFLFIVRITFIDFLQQPEQPRPYGPAGKLEMDILRESIRMPAHTLPVLQRLTGRLKRKAAQSCITQPIFING